VITENSVIPQMVRYTSTLPCDLLLIQYLFQIVASFTTSIFRKVV